ncbi:MAG: hypothetical protein Q8L66_03905 [Caulobacter sp.]|nr:hypothetical protein [Caulobacter sp.]
MAFKIKTAGLALLAASAVAVSAHADENLFGYVQGSETLPKGALEAYGWATVRSDKGAGKYRATDYELELEYGVSDRFTASGALLLMSLDTSGLVIDGYLPGARDFAVKPTGLEVKGKYNFLSPAKDDIGLSVQASGEYLWIDPHSGQDKDTLSASVNVIVQKYFLEGQMIWAGNAGMEATYADRGEIANLPIGFDWPTDPEMEIELKAATALTYRFAPNWFVGGEALYETEFETEVGQERWSVFAGPTVHYGGPRWWATLSWMKQLRGGGERYAGQTDNDLHLIEKTKQEVRLKIGYNF